MDDESASFLPKFALQFLSFFLSSFYRLVTDRPFLCFLVKLMPCLCFAFMYFFYSFQVYVGVVQTLDIVAENRDKLRVVALATASIVALLTDQVFIQSFGSLSSYLSCRSRHSKFSCY
ncbi:unnamed protein product [Ilex paraguariensis]|uniref:Uncharacterized protein n=1 Tax=Ilex paraguariensis TaxID=185542 RepID=A0ABC8S765_9AQUA